MEGGSVSIVSDTWTDYYREGTFVATAAPGYEFTGWTYNQEKDIFNTKVYNANDSELIIRFVMITNRNKTATANFSPIEYAVTAAADTGGTATVSSDDGAPYYYDELVTFTATPDTTNGFTFNGWYNGTDSTPVSDSVTYSVNITGDLALTARFNAPAQNSAPIANDDYATTRMNTSVVINVLINDFDPDSLDMISPPVVVLGTSTQGGTVVVNSDGTITYSSVDGFTGSDEFTYTITDLAGLSATATVSVNVINPSLIVTKTASDDSVLVGDNVTYTVTVKNNGNVNFDGGIELYDNMLSLDSIYFGPLVIGDTLTHTYTLPMNDIGSITNTAVVIAYWNGGIDQGTGTDIKMTTSMTTSPYQDVTFSASAVVTVSAIPPTASAPAPSSPVTKYSLAVTIVGPGSVLPGSGSFDEGSIVVMNVAAGAGAHFVGWEGPNGGEVSSDRISMTGSKSITAVFAEDVVAPDDVIPQSGDATEDSSDSDNQNEAILDETVPEAAPELPDTGGIPLELLMSVGFILTTSGVTLKKLNKK